MAIVSNYGSAIGEAIGASMEKALEVLLIRWLINIIIIISRQVFERKKLGIPLKSS